VSVVKQKRKLTIQGAMEGDVQNAKRTKTLNPRAEKNTHQCKVLSMELEMISFGSGVEPGS
jgi:hypothetical protein